jgi:hypothetical protein
MPGLVVNAAAAMEARKPWEEGEYHVILTGQKVVTRVPEGKFPYISLEFTAADDEGVYAGRKAFRILSTSPDASFMLTDYAIALGADPDDVTAEEVDFDQVFRELHGQEAWVRTSIRDYDQNGETRQQTQIDRISNQPSV